MSTILIRVGKALVKFIKPVRVAPPHYPGQKYPALGNDPYANQNDLPDSQQKNLKLVAINGKKPQADSAAQSIKSIEIKKIALPDKPFNNWIDLVVYMIDACKKASDGIRKRVGHQIYYNSVMNKTGNKIMTKGSIVNTMTIAAEDRKTDDDKADTTNSGDRVSLSNKKDAA